MRFLTIVVVILLTAVSASAQACDRACLRGMITGYLEAMVKHDTNSLPLADDVRFTEDANEMRLGEGLWKSISGLGSFRQDVLDVREGTAGVHFVAMEGDQPVLAAVRLKIVNGRISEVESTVVRNRTEGMIFRPEAVKDASPAMNLKPTEAQRMPRAELEHIALLYPGGLRIGSFVDAGTPFAPEAYRFENGQLMAGPGCTFIPGCANIREQRLPTLSGITSRIAAVDEEQGIVWLRMNFGPGSVRGPDPVLSVWEMFKIYDGRIQAVEAFMETIPARKGSGWDR